MTYGTVNADLITTSDGVSSAGLYGFKNRIINGDMRIDQRNAGASVTPTNGQYLVDRWIYYGNQSSKATAQQNAASVTPPVGFTKYLGFTSSSAYSVLTGDYFATGQHIEGFNTADLAWGTASAAPVTLSFWVRSSLTGTFGGVISNGGTRSYPFTYTISSANTWEKETITIPGDTSGSWGSSNSYGVTVYLGLGVGTTFSGTAGSWSGNSYFSATGATSVVGTSGATFYLTGVQLEKGSTATSFDYLDYGRSLMQCQRYLPAFVADSGTANMVGAGGFNSATSCAITFTFPIQSRVAPTGITVSSVSHFNVTDNTLGSVCSGVVFNAAGNTNAQVYFQTATSYATYRAGAAYSSNSAAKILFNGCEL